MKKLLLPFYLLVLTILAQPAFALLGNYNYISAAEVKTNIEQKTPMTLVDIQVKNEFDQHHIIDAVATYAYPVKSPEERGRIDAAIAELRTNKELAVVVCPRGGGGAKRAYDYLVESGIAEERVFILTKGQAAWPYPELLEQ